MNEQSTGGSARQPARPARSRKGTFERGHKKLGGRKRGTPNAFSHDWKNAITEAATRIGFDGNGKDGIRGYFTWLGLYHRPALVLLACRVDWQALEDLPEEARPTVEQTQEQFEKCIGLTGGNRSRTQTTRRESATDYLAECLAAADSLADWTGQDFPVSFLMHMAITEPKLFCKLIARAFLPASTRRRKSAATHRLNY